MRDSVEKGSYRFFSKIEHCQNNSKFLCLGVLNNALSFFLLDFALFSRYKVCKKNISFPSGIWLLDVKQKKCFKMLSWFYCSAKQNILFCWRTSELMLTDVFCTLYNSKMKQDKKVNNGNMFCIKITVHIYFLSYTKLLIS